jgi:hypothetical protein
MRNDLYYGLEKNQNTYFLEIWKCAAQIHALIIFLPKIQIISN